MMKRSGGTKGVVAVAMSGGVDSSVAAALLKEDGYEVIGVTMNLFSLPKEVCTSEDLRSCCGWKAQEDANRVAVALGIPHFVVDFRREFERSVIDDFCAEYGRGRTPNPCIRCNRFIKFDLFFERARRLGAEFIATGHYARIGFDPSTGRRLLKKGLDAAKDQSYFLYPLSQVELSRTLFPVGGHTKDEIRGLAARLRLPVAQKKESQEICFIPDNDYPGFLKKRFPEAFRPGPIVDLDGTIIGKHGGIAHFTVGQRKGMGIAAPRPLYVVAVDTERNTIVAGESEDLYKRRLEATDLNWISLNKLDEPKILRARIRYKHAEAPAKVSPRDEGRVLVEFERAQRAVTPGQAAVFYDGDVVAGGGLIDRALD
ncbi:MAG: tRNA 2-thiouridine(34) synthase MnmA [Candidatus Aminicenantes bacterium]|nr:tRNA 2-thiouridine(34) synthase MnmA [Candidatus Aminicenantes bacterium]